MNYTLNLTVKCESKTETKQLLRLFSPEDKKLSNGRANYIIKENNIDLIFEIEAKDAVALRATITSISKTLDVYEKTKNIS